MTQPTSSLRCPGTLGRRAFLRSGLVGLCSLGLADLLRLRAAAGPSAKASPKSMIVLWLWGGPTPILPHGEPIRELI